MDCSLPGSSVHGLLWTEPSRLQCSGEPFPSPGDFPDPGIKPTSPALQAYSLPPEGRDELEIVIDKYTILYRGFPGDSDIKESACNVGNLSSIPGLGRSPGEENGNPLKYSCLENSMDRVASWAIIHGVAKSQTRLSN